MTFVLLCCFVVCSRRAAGFPERHLRPCLLRPPEHRGRHRYGQERRGVHQADARLVRGEGGGTRVRGPTMPRQGANTARMPAAPSAGPSSGVTGGGQAFSKNRANKRFGKSIRSGHRRANRFGFCRRWRNAIQGSWLSLARRARRGAGRDGAAILAPGSGPTMLRVYCRSQRSWRLGARDTPTGYK
jgi:hypothetical protein